MKNTILFLLILTFSISLATVRTVNIVGFTFAPETLNALAGDTVRWINTDTRIHTTTSGTNGVQNGIWNSGNMAQGDSFKFIFTNQGNYPYYCIPHFAMGMTGLIIVSSSEIKELNTATKPMLAAGNYPNPFQSNIRINYEITRPGKVTIKIYDALGKPVKNLVNRQTAIGNYAVNWDGTNQTNEEVQNGLYFYRINFNGTNYTGKILKTD